MCKKVYQKPTMKVVVMKHKYHLLVGSPVAKSVNRLVDDPNWEWDEEGGN